MDNTKTFELLSKYYDDLIFDIENNEIFRKIITKHISTENILYMTSENVYESLWHKILLDNTKILMGNEKSHMINNTYKINCLAHNKFIENISKKSIFIKNALSVNVANRIPFRYYHSDEYSERENFENELNSLKNLFDTTESNLVKYVASGAIAKVYRGAFTTSSVYSSIKKDYFFNENKELYQRLNNDKKYWEASIAINESVDVFSKGIQGSIAEILHKGGILLFKRNYEKQDTIIGFLNEIRELQLSINKNYPNDAKRFEKIIKDKFCTDLYTYANKESTPLQSQYVNLLLPIMGKERESGLSLLKSEFKRDLSAEKAYSFKDLYNVNLLINFKKNNKKIKDLLSIHFNILHEEGLSISMKKLNEKTYSFGIALNEEDRKGLSNDDIIDLKDIFKDVLVNKINEILLDDKTDNISSLRELSLIFAKELRAYKIKISLSKDDKKETKKLKI